MVKLLGLRFIFLGVERILNIEILIFSFLQQNLEFPTITLFIFQQKTRRSGLIFRINQTLRRRATNPIKPKPTAIMP